MDREPSGERNRRLMEREPSCERERELISRAMERISRREFLEESGAALALAGALPAAARADAADAPSAARTTVRLNVNGVEHRVDVEDRWTLAEVLRDRLP